MRAVFQLPASMTSVVDALRAVSSDASPTRPLCAVTRASMPAARAGPHGEAALNLPRTAQERQDGRQDDGQDLFSPLSAL